MNTTIQALETLLPKQAVSELLATYGNPYDVLLHTEEKEWRDETGCGYNSILKLRALRTLLRNFQQRPFAQLPSANSPSQIFKMAKDMQHFDVEYLRVLYLNVKHKVMISENLFKGTINTALISNREIYSKAVKIKAAAIILIHNHPTGDPSPSSNDLRTTQSVVEAGKILNIPLLDHIIIGHNTYYSLNEHGHI